MRRCDFALGAGAALAFGAAPGHVHGANGVVELPENRVLEWRLPVLDGPDMRLSAYRGRVVVLAVFTVSNANARQQQPALVAFALAHDDTAVFGIDYRDDDNAVRAYRKAFAVPYAIAMDRDGESLRAIVANERPAIPTTIVIRPDGTLSSAWTGARDRDWLERERDDALGLARPSPQPP